MKKREESVALERLLYFLPALPFALALCSLVILFISSVANPGISQQEKYEEFRCKNFSYFVSKNSSRRNDAFVVDASDLHALHGTQQSTDFWFKQIVGENYLVENEDYVIDDSEKNRRYLLTIAAAHGVVSKVIEDHTSIFEIEKKKTRGARLARECLRKIEENTP